MYLCITQTPTSPLFIPFSPLQAVDVQFLDHMRRGTSISMADLASDPPPATLRDAYALLTVTNPSIVLVESDIKTLQEEVKRRKLELAEAEAKLSEYNPPVFRAAQVCLWLV